MKSKYLAFLSLILISNSLMSQDISKKYPDLIKEVAQINQNKNFDTVILNENELKQISNSSSLIGFFLNDRVQKITQISQSEFGIESFDYYFSNDELIYVNETFDQINKKGDLNSHRSFYGRYYFNNDKMYDYETTGHNRFENDKIDPETVLLRESNRNVSLLKKKKNSH